VRYREHDGKIKLAVLRVSKPLTWLSFLRAAGRSAVPLEGKKLDFSRSFSAPAIQKYPRDPREQRPTNFEILIGVHRHRDRRRVSSTRFCAAGSRRVEDQIRRPQGGVVPRQRRGFVRGRPRSPAAVCSPPTVAPSSRPGWSTIRGGPSARRVVGPRRLPRARRGHPGRREGLHVRRHRRPHRRHGLRATRPQRPASSPLHRHAGGCRRDD
jgi:hypothetical protein